MEEKLTIRYKIFGKEIQEIRLTQNFCGSISPVQLKKVYSVDCTDILGNLSYFYGKFAKD